MIAYEHGGEIYDKEIQLDFSVNINPFGMPKSVKKAILSNIDKYKKYPDDSCRKLREAVAQKKELPSEWILCGNGAADIIYRLCYAKKPQKVLLLAPTFSEYEKALLQVNSQIEYYFLKEEYNFSIQEDFLEYLQEEIDMVFLCNPNNPVGNLIEPAILHKILSICKEKNIFLAVDECFMEFTKENTSIEKETKNNRQVFIIKAFTKTYAMAGLRLGYGICSDKELLKNMKQAGPPWAVSTVALEAGIAALEEEEYRKQTISYLEKERKFLEAELSKLGFQVFPSQANYILWKCINSSEDLYEKMLEKRILIRQCRNYQGLGRNYYRICVGLPEHNREFLEQLKSCLEENTWQK